MSGLLTEPVWPVDLETVRLWPMESGDGPLLQELFDDLRHFRETFGEPGKADAVSTFINLPEGWDYESKLLVGIWRNGGLVGALDCIMGYPARTVWTLGLLVIAQRHRRSGIASSVITWLEATAASCGAVTTRVVLRRTNHAGSAFLSHRGYELEDKIGDPDWVTAVKRLS
jgi:GNAT superfamily N-acetyltransferase